MSLWKSKEVLAMAAGLTSHGNRHLVVDNYDDIRFMVELIMESSIFEHQAGRGKEVQEYRDLFATGSIVIAGSKPINMYKKRARGNWDSTNAIDIGDDMYNLDDKELAARDEEDDTGVQDLEKNYEAHEN